MAAIVTNELAPPTLGLEEQVAMYAGLDYIELAKITVEHMKIRKKLVHGIQVTEVEMEVLRIAIM